MNTTEVENWWDRLSARQRIVLLGRVGATDAKLENRKWYQLSKWVRRGLRGLKAYQLVVPIE